MLDCGRMPVQYVYDLCLLALGAELGAVIAVIVAIVVLLYLLLSRFGGPPGGRMHR